MPNHNLYQLATHHNSLPQNHRIFEERQAVVNNTEHYYTGNNYVHLRTIQMYDRRDLFDLFQEGDIGPSMDYVFQAIDNAQGEDVPDVGSLLVSMMMESDFRAPGRHLAVFLFSLFPHRQFHNGHVIVKEIDEGSILHQHIERLFHISTRAVVLQATQYDILSFMADEQQMLDLKQRFLVGFNPMKFSFDGDNYFVDPEAADNHNEHECCDNQMVAIMRGLPWQFQNPEINEVAGADDEINQGFVEDEIYIINNDFIFDRNIINNDLNQYINNYIYPEPEAEQNFRVQG
jgi:hypothetical protein